MKWLKNWIARRKVPVPAVGQVWSNGMTAVRVLSVVPDRFGSGFTVHEAHSRWSWLDGAWVTNPIHNAAEYTSNRDWLVMRAATRQQLLTEAK